MENSTLAKVCQAAKAARLYALKLVNISLDNILRAFYLRENASPQLYLKDFASPWLNLPKNIQNGYEARGNRARQRQSGAARYDEL